MQQEVRVFKFGGTSVGSAEAIRLAVARVREAAPKVVAVVSAMNGVTDLLIHAAERALAGELDGSSEAARRFSALHLDLIAKLITSRKSTLELEERVEHLAHELVSMCESIAILRELTVRSRDAIVARGERMMAEIFTAALRDATIDATLVDAADVILTERRVGSLWPKFDACEKRGERLIGPLLAAGRAVVLPGFIGRGPEGEVVTLGRGGSDFAAAIIARVVQADSLTLWKEVDGLMTADPKMVPDARVLPELHYREAAELAYYGAKVLHPRTMIPLVDRGIPLFVRNSFNPSFSGTRIAADVTAGTYPVKALTAVHRQALITIEGSGMLGVPGIAARAFGALAQAGHSVSMISQSSSEASICFVVPDTEAADAVRALNEAFAIEISTRLVDTVRSENGIALLAVVGLGMRGTPGIAARTFTALSHAQVNIIAIAQGSSELNITVTVREADVPRALLALHQEFQLEKLRPLPHRDRSESSLTLLGFGQIGRALTRQIVSQETYFKHDLGIRLRNIAIADRSGFRIAEDGFTGDELTLLMQRKESGQRIAETGSDHVASIDFLRNEMRSHVWSLPASRSIVIDVTADETAPLLMESLRRRCHVVVANKKPLAVAQSEFDAMMTTARESGVSLRYEATVGAGLPVLDTLAKLKEAGDQVETILGCLSGTLGYLMTQLEDGVAFSAAVRQAHALGYTEPDPREDLAGMDVARKALILARTLGRKCELADIAVESLFPVELGDADAQKFISNLERVDGEVAARVARAREKRNVLRYVARVERDAIRVGLEEVPADSPIGRLRGTDNQVVLQTRRYQTNPLIVTGPGAGAEVTAAGVLNDIIAIATGAR